MCEVIWFGNARKKRSERTSKKEDINVTLQGNGDGRKSLCISISYEMWSIAMDSPKKLYVGFSPDKESRFLLLSTKEGLRSWTCSGKETERRKLKIDLSNIKDIKGFDITKFLGKHRLFIDTANNRFYIKETE